MPLRLLIWILALLVAASTFGGEEEVLPPNVRFTHFTHSSGLPAGAVTSILQDGQGYIWIGTSQGVCRFDGYQVKLFPAAK